MDCTCDACSALAAKYASDPQLLQFYRKKLPVRGWAGKTNGLEKAYILTHAEWARGAAERGTAILTINRACREKVHTQTPSLEEEVSEGLECETGGLIKGSAATTVVFGEA